MSSMQRRVTRARAGHTRWWRSFDLEMTVAWPGVTPSFTIPIPSPVSIRPSASAPVHIARVTGIKRIVVSAPLISQRRRTPTGSSHELFACSIWFRKEEGDTVIGRISGGWFQRSKVSVIRVDSSSCPRFSGGHLLGWARLGSIVFPDSGKLVNKETGNTYTDRL